MTENPNWVEVDKILVEIGNMGKNFLHLKGVEPLHIERWRWDEPVITFRWLDKCGINKHIYFVVDESDGQYSVRAGASAWLDNRETLNRKWVGIAFTPFPTIGGPELPDLVRRKILDHFEIVFQKIFAVEEKDLVNTASLQSMPNM